ncbi:MAG: DUF59 domain-containing protein [Streptosporangiales bacterium]|nr:DUF59 domain-containing protein [Streptosporangiales bacterium]
MDVTELVRERLRAIPEPHLPAGIGDLGMVRQAEIHDGRLDVQLALPCVACPAKAVMADDISAELDSMPGVDSVAVQVTWAEPWSKSGVTPEGRKLLAEGGVQL